jgi:hypothetical protein
MTLNKNVNKDSNNRLDTILRNSLKIDDYEMIHNFINENTFLNKKYISILNLNDDGDFIDYMKSQVKSDSSSINTIIYDSIKITIQNYLFQNFEINRKQKISFEIPISILTNGIIQSLIKNYEVNYSKKILSK